MTDLIDELIPQDVKNHKILLYGESGTGKTYAMRTLLQAGQKVRFLAAEQNAISGTAASLRALQKECKNDEEFKELAQGFALSVISGKVKSLSILKDAAKKSIALSLDAQLKAKDPKKKEYKAFLDVLEGFEDFVDVRGESYGCVADWGTDTTLMIDSNTIICEGIMQHVIGGKVAPSQPEWGAAQGWYKKTIRMLTEELTCNVVVIGHPTRVTDPVSGTSKIYPLNLGVALNNWLPGCFSEVIWAYRKKDQFFWSTADQKAVTRAKALPIKDAIAPDFRLIFNK